MSPDGNPLEYVLQVIADQYRQETSEVIGAVRIQGAQG
jgi:hypothetical protein